MQSPGSIYKDSIVPFDSSYSECLLTYILRSLAAIIIKNIYTYLCCKLLKLKHGRRPVYICRHKIRVSAPGFKMFCKFGSRCGFPGALQAYKHYGYRWFCSEFKTIRIPAYNLYKFIIYNLNKLLSCSKT